MLLLALDWGGVSYPWGSALIINLFWGSAVAAALFVLWERHLGDSAMLPLALFSQGIVSFSAVARFMSYGGLYVILVYLPLWFQAVMGLSPFESGVRYLPSVVSTTLGTLLSGFLGWCCHFFAFPLWVGTFS